MPELNGTVGYPAGAGELLGGADTALLPALGLLSEPSVEESPLSIVFPDDGRRKHIFCVQQPSLPFLFSRLLWCFVLFALCLSQPAVHPPWAIRVQTLAVEDSSPVACSGAPPGEVFCCTVSWRGCLPSLGFLLFLIPLNLKRLRSPCSSGRPW